MDEVITIKIVEETIVVTPALTVAGPPGADGADADVTEHEDTYDHAAIVGGLAALVSAASTAESLVRIDPLGGGDFLTVNDAIAAGKGEMYLVPGTHSLTGDITLDRALIDKGRFAIVGDSSFTTHLDFGSFSIALEDSSRPPYSAGILQFDGAERGFMSAGVHTNDEIPVDVAQLIRVGDIIDASDNTWGRPYAMRVTDVTADTVFFDRPLDFDISPNNPVQYSTPFTHFSLRGFRHSGTADLLFTLTDPKGNGYPAVPHRAWMRDIKTVGGGDLFDDAFGGEWLLEDCYAIFPGGGSTYAKCTLAGSIVSYATLVDCVFTGSQWTQPTQKFISCGFPNTNFDADIEMDPDFEARFFGCYDSVGPLPRAGELRGRLRGQVTEDSIPLTASALQSYSFSNGYTNHYRLLLDADGSNIWLGGDPPAGQVRSIVIEITQFSEAAYTVGWVTPIGWLTPDGLEPDLTTIPLGGKGVVVLSNSGSGWMGYPMMVTA